MKKCFWLKKNAVRIGGALYIIEQQETKTDKFALAHSFILRQQSMENGYNKTECLRMFGVSESGYYAWLGRLIDRDGKQKQKKESRNNIKDMIRRIIAARNGVIPGKRTFRAELFRRFHISVNTKRIASIMKEMNLVAQRPHKDAYKHQASHNHPCAAPANGVCQDFFVGPRRVILTDITYLYYGVSRDVFYLCVFRDAYTRENLGWDMDTHMDTGLVKRAYEAMKTKHGDEFKDSSVYIHSDQGSQYLSTDFKQLLEDDGFIQSVSARGNSQDNAPMESFFGRLKTAVLDMVAMCMSLDAAEQLVDGYLNAYNNEHYQYDLAALTPAEFYQYATTGVYPLDSYFGVPASEMMAVGDLKKVRRKYADEEAAKRREASAARREQKRMVDPEKVIRRDQGILMKKILEWKKSEEQASVQVGHLQEILDKADEAMKFVRTQSKEVLEILKDPLAWRNYNELSYVFSMNELF